jgi:hypothetical protein
VIMLGTALAERLANYSKTTAQRYGKGAPQPANMSTSQLEKLGLMPDAKKYDGLLAALRGQSSKRVIPQPPPAPALPPDGPRPAPV